MPIHKRMVREEREVVSGVCVTALDLLCSVVGGWREAGR